MKRYLPQHFPGLKFVFVDFDQTLYIESRQPVDAIAEWRTESTMPSEDLAFYTRKTKLPNIVLRDVITPVAYTYYVLSTTKSQLMKEARKVYLNVTYPYTSFEDVILTSTPKWEYIEDFMFRRSLKHDDVLLIDDRMDILEKTNPICSVLHTSLLYEEYLKRI